MRRLSGRMLGLSPRLRARARGFPPALLRRAASRLELPTALSHGAALLEPAHDAIEAGGVDPELGSRLPDADARAVLDELEQLLLALPRRHATARATADRLRGGCGRARAARRLTSRTPAPGAAAHGRRRCGGNVNAEPLGRLLELVVLGHSRL